LARFYAEIHNHLLEVASLSINKNVDFFEPEEGFAENFVPGIAEGVPVLRPKTQVHCQFSAKHHGSAFMAICIFCLSTLFAIHHDNLYCHASWLYLPSIMVQESHVILIIYIQLKFNRSIFYYAVEQFVTSLQMI